MAITIIGLLAAILLPTLARAKLLGHRAVSRNNLKQISTAYLMYEHDHGHTIPYNATSKNSAWAAHFSRLEDLSERTLIAPLCQKPAQDGQGDSKTAWAFGTAVTVTNPPPVTSTIGNLTFQCIGSATYGLIDVSIDLTPGTPVYFLALSENIATYGHILAVFKTGDPYQPSVVDFVRKQRPITDIPGLKIGLNGNGQWGFYQWKGPLCSRMAWVLGRSDWQSTKGLTEVGQYPNDSYTTHTTPVGFGQATSTGSGGASTWEYPNGYSGTTDINFIYMSTWLEVDSPMTVKFTVFGDDIVAAFIGSPPNNPNPPNFTPPPRPVPVAGSYSINAWAQVLHPLESVAGSDAFYSHAELGDSRVPIFAEGIWADVLAQPDDPIPTHTDGVDAGMGRIYIDRYHDGRNNLAFMDGHVDGVKLGQLWSSPWHRKWPLPAR